MFSIFLVITCCLLFELYTQYNMNKNRTHDVLLTPVP